jgi:hypothetical protein
MTAGIAACFLHNVVTGAMPRECGKRPKISVHRTALQKGVDLEREASRCEVSALGDEPKTRGERFRLAQSLRVTRTGR